MKRHFVSGTAIAGLLLLATAAWTQDPEPVAPVKTKAEPPTYRDVLGGYVGRKCSASLGDRVCYLRFPEDKKTSWPSATLAAAGSDFVQLVWEDGEQLFIPTEWVAVQVAK
jgi:hypothetical protein